MNAWFGGWDMGYRSGTTGSPSIPANAKVLQIFAIGGAVGGTFTINGGNTVTLGSGQQISIKPVGNLVTPSLTSTNTSSYFVEFLT